MAMVLPAEAQDKVIKVGYLSQVHDGPIIALEDALAGQYQFEYVKFLRYADAEIALTNGDIDISSLGYVSAVTAAARGAEPAYQFFVGQSRGAINLVCRQDAEVKDWSDLTKQVVGVLTGGPAEIFFNDAVTSHGVKLEDIERVTFPVPGPPLLQALQDGTITCMAVYEPFAASAVADGYGVYPALDLADNTFLGINGGIAANTSFLTDNPEFITAATKAVVEAADTFPKNKTQWLGSVTTLLGIPEKTAEISTEHLSLDWRLYRNRVGTLAKAVAALGVIAEAPSSEAIDKYFTYEFLTAATGQSADALGAND
ncbi:MAG TPA: ABC transporter substrate-binding protein [Devosia sp.]|nr:ABC transporter substrate-binding protein [Devosia sp.]